MNVEKILNLGGPLLLGAVTTVEITLAALVLAIVIGLSFALLKLTRFKALHWLIDAYVELFRNTPVLWPIWASRSPPFRRRSSDWASTAGRS
jgi:polar amino acid transport system permease protein